MIMRNLVLIGFMGSGKSTVGRLVANELEMHFVDVDQWIEKRERMSIANIFSQQGEVAFRELETQAVRELAKQENLVIATGGGVVLRRVNVEVLGKTGILIYLSIDAKTALERTKKHSHRPLLRERKSEEQMEALFRERQDLYQAIPHCVQSAGRSVTEVVADVIRIYRSNESHKG